MGMPRVNRRHSREISRECSRVRGANVRDVAFLSIPHQAGRPRQ
jgi:hypothetical protein